jgi:hypothetical protein
MKRFLAITLITLAVSVIVRSQDHTRPPSLPSPSATPLSNPGGWMVFNSEAGRFSALMPEVPTEQTETTQSEHGPYTTHLFIVNRKGLNSVFLIGWVDYDPNFNFNRAAELDMNRENFIKGVKATLINNRPTTFDGYQAIEFTAENAEKIFRSRVYMVGRRPYQLVTVTPKGIDDSANINRFFSSFKVRPR